MKPLAYRMRPQNLDQVVGQLHLIGPGKIIRRMVEARLLSSMILYGPPGIGKTSIASAIAGSTKYAFRKLNAATDGKKQLQQVAAEGKMSGTVILLLDEIHRLDKTKQDFLLPLLESGQIILIGATTENPYISISPAIRSRCQIFELKPLSAQDASSAIDRALTDKENGLGNYPVELTDDARSLLIEKGNGDLRSTLNSLELAVLSTKQELKDNHQDTDSIVITQQEMADSIQMKVQNFDSSGDGHYDLVSAFQKSIRGSDTDAALHYLAKLIESGDLISICRRLSVIAYEDIGLANPSAAEHAILAIQAAQTLGFPEARIPLANAVIELALSPKSNSAITAIDRAIYDVKNKNIGSIPVNLKDAHYSGAKKLGHGVNYIYPHDFENDWVAQQYLPDNLLNASYFTPKGNSKVEERYKLIYQKLKKMQHKNLNKHSNS
ncbi:MAG: replication-associated recombination protein A [Lactobacillus kefiranofaciens]|uniref:replication-associated recombination protein A n=1 Tax=Lactobacillus TaxID=1578 RepID=UPI001562A0E5|nr:replication-associated recombination protein A [Lactobacillus helveticus]MDN5584397.1 replication-associated recombination protein A [Lactobacillus sp.]MCO0806627.1 replication-associated recombination protein A [Lactobacillus helveticus]MCP9316695.1 replication-associated recombination protein A [Lactobacillus helveticus]MDH5817045.1 replication-associated recombination protein A [Lactobacillus helveticus]MDN6024198.1 replication-associated recombination protein A [Lactobacillus sp.]